MKPRSWAMLFLALCLSVCGCGLIDHDDDTETSEVVETPGGRGAAPCIYLYPEEAGEISVALIPGEYAWLTSSDPEYGDGWTVWAEPNGLIDGVYDYLYYSCRVAMEFQMDEGWAVESEEIFPWFEEILPRLGLSQSETEDFIDYWSVHLPSAPCYLIYPQGNDLVGRQIDIAVDPEPDRILRLWLVIEPVEECESLIPPELTPFERYGFTVVEWGVVFREDIGVSF
jgi:hypothetical protein